jgi:hypothetical protein
LGFPYEMSTKNYEVIGRAIEIPTTENWDWVNFGMSIGRQFRMTREQPVLILWAAVEY